MRLFEIKENQIIFYPKRHDFLALGIILFVSLSMISIPIFFNMNEQSLNIGSIPILLAIFIPLIILVLFIILSKTQIIINTKEKTVVRRNLFVQTKLASLDNVCKVQFSDSGSSYVTTYIYELIFKDDIYGQGIRLTPALREKSKKLKEIYDNAIIKVDSFLSENISTDSNTNTIQKIHFFNEIHRGCYSYRQKSIVALIFSILPLIPFVYLTIFQPVDSYYQYIFILFSIIFLVAYGKEVKIDTDNNTIESSTFGFFKSKCLFIEIAEIEAQKSFYNGSYSTTNIIVRTNRDKKPYQIHLASIKNTKKVALFINDLAILLPSINQRL
ncbi:hypothetical protein CLV62_10930 [Dysgonomonas alginatilytica]|uniref:Uncharacterized protein n=1 Tax=Dysgonomonas alginatilytica TaxID=1605892 RepID=A0A2V3PQZ4_9BACT|nr:hypothetical protein [Dysgonomonas alginatilytica]PXV64704.1 hypothetical protein CLV62_10930 [Dysgonomonas alginatilytica]